MAFRGVDYYGIDELLTDEERMTRDTVRAFVDEKVMPRIGRWFREGEFGKLGLLGITVEGYGCQKLSPVQYGLVCQELERGDSGIRSFVSVQNSLAMWPIA